MPNMFVNISSKWCKNWHRHGNSSYSIIAPVSCILDMEPCIPCLSTSWFYLSASKKLQLFGRAELLQRLAYIHSHRFSPISRKINFDGLKHLKVTFLHLAVLLRSLRPEWRLHVSVTCQEKETADQLKPSAETCSTHCNPQFLRHRQDTTLVVHHLKSPGI